MNQSCLIIAGEKSGEEHALSFFPELKKLNPDVQFFGVGGNDLKKLDVDLLFHLNDFSSWGYSEVIAKIPFYKEAMETILSEVSKRNCKIAILIDFQSFNMKLAAKLKEAGVEVLYYVAPQAWAWKEYRVKKIADTVNTLFTIIPFEKKWFSDRGVRRVIGVEHPQLNLHKKEIEKFKRESFKKDKIKILLLPGSRNFEVHELLPIFIESIVLLKREMNLEVSIVKSSTVTEELYLNFTEYFDKVYQNDDLVTAIKDADFAFAASGTVTLSCALFELPTIVCYRTSLINAFIFETFVNYKGPVSLANIVHNHSVFPELLQDSVSSFNIATHLKFWYYNQESYLGLRGELANTKHLVKGEDVDIGTFMTSELIKAYGNKTNTNL